MKRLLTIALTLALALMLTLFLAACGGNDTPSSTTEQTPPSDTPVANDSTPTSPASDMPSGGSETPSSTQDLANDLSSLMREEDIYMIYEDGSDVVKEGLGLNAGRFDFGNRYGDSTDWGGGWELFIFQDGEYIINGGWMEYGNMYNANGEKLGGCVLGTWSYENYVLKLDNGFEFTLDPAIREFTQSTMPGDSNGDGNTAPSVSIPDNGTPPNVSAPLESHAGDKGYFYIDTDDYIVYAFDSTWELADKEYWLVSFDNDGRITKQSTKYVCANEADAKTFIDNRGLTHAIQIDNVVYIERNDMDHDAWWDKDTCRRYAENNHPDAHYISKP